MIKKISKRLDQRGGGIGERGQIAIFVALIFQVLFVFFAMVVNIGLLVHHKINLQNSVDLAAYYGGMKQAEVMNAVAHINYQIKQAFKLQVFRYRHIGMAGDTYNHPYDSLTSSLRGAAETDKAFRAADGQECGARFCVNYPVFDLQEPNEYYCRDLCKGVKITLLGIPSVSAVNFGLAEGILGGLARSIEDASKALVEKTQKHCRTRSALNWFALARFILSYRQEMIARKQTLNLLANSISSKTDDMTDLDGESVKAGVLATLYRNLSYPNQENIDPDGGTSEGGRFKFYNSLGHPGCAGTAGERRIPPKWLNEIFIKPLYMYMEGTCAESVDSVGYTAQPMNAGKLPAYTEGIDPNMVNELMRLMQEPSDLKAADNRLWHSTVGYEKNPWCMAYVAVDAETSPKIPFSPFSPVKLKARGFAKPFGGRIGPWYYSKWPAGDIASRGGDADKIDPTLPRRVVSGEAPPPFEAKDADVDFARYAGDKIGTKSTMTMGYVGKGIWDPHRPPNQTKWSIYDHLLSANSYVGDPGSPGDIMAWNKDGSPLPMRDLELAFIAPDQFDLTYYSIEPDWWNNYALRLQKRSDFAGIHVRGDMGYRKGAGPPWETMTVKDQMERARTQNRYNFGKLSYYAGAESTPALAFTELLTSWHMNQPGNYVLTPDRMGKCADGWSIPPGNTGADIAVPGNCLVGGRTGYSVKLVDGAYLQDPNLEIGGQGVSGRLLNSWTDEDTGD